jgi:hypothetical protein
MTLIYNHYDFMKMEKSEEGRKGIEAIVQR